MNHPDPSIEIPPAAVVNRGPATTAGLLITAGHVADWWADGGACDAMYVGDDRIPGLIDHLNNLADAVRAYRDHNTTEEP